MLDAMTSEPTEPTRVGATAEREFTVTAADTAAALGSGDLDVLGTPRLVAWCEAVTCVVLAGELATGTTSVGTRVAVDHLAATPVDGRVRVVAELVGSAGRSRTLAVVATDAATGRTVGEGEVTRAVVDVERFLDRLR